METMNETAKKHLRFLLVRIGSWTSARWDQHLRHEFGDKKTDETIAWLKESGFDVDEMRGRPSAPKGEVVKPRELGDVIDAMLVEVPETESGLRAALAGIKSSNAFAPPEGARMWWKATVDLLMNEIGEPKSGWQKRVAAIFSGKMG